MGPVKVVAVCTRWPDVKRLFLPGVILKDTCPSCGTSVERDLGGEDYVYYGSYESFYCHDCEHEWEYPKRLSLALVETEVKR